MAWSPWIDLAMPERDPMEAQPFDMPAPTGPRYPYGMRLCFDNHCIDVAEMDMTDLADGPEGVSRLHEADRERRCGR